MRPLWLALAVLPLVVAGVFRRRLGVWQWLLALGLSAVVLVYGVGFVDIPSPGGVIDGVTSALGVWFYVIVAAMAFLETSAFVGLVAPGGSVILLGGFLAGRGDLDLLLLIGIVWAAALLGDTVSYLLGRKFGRDFIVRNGSRVGLKEPQIARVERYFGAHGGKTIVVGRFIGFVRVVAPLIAGASRMRASRFVSAGTLGAGLWAAQTVMLGFLLYHGADTATTVMENLQLALVAAVAVIVVGATAIVFTRYPHHRDRAIALARSATGRQPA